MQQKTIINLSLLGLVILDLIYAALCFFFPDFWFRFIHGASYVDPQGLLRRTGAIWATFALVQLITLIRWRKESYWIAIITGVRMSEIFADWTYLAFAQDLTTFGRIALFLATPANLLVSWFFLRTYLSQERTTLEQG